MNRILLRQLLAPIAFYLFLVDHKVEHLLEFSHQYLENCKVSGQKPIAEDHPVFTYAKEIGLPHDFLRLQWLEFKERYLAEEDKTYKAWPTVFAKSVRDNWFRLWMFKDDQYVLTTTGLQAQKLHKVAA